MQPCDHKGWEFVDKKIRRGGKIVLRVWCCARCRALIPPPRMSKSDRMVREFKGGLSRRQVAREFKVSVAQLDQAIRKRLR